VPVVFSPNNVGREVRQRDTARIACTVVSDNALEPPPVWVTSDSGLPSPPADTPPNAAFIDDPDVVSDKRLDSSAFSFFEGCYPQVTFRHNFNLEASEIQTSALMVEC